jgi:hypothetical protein
MSSATTLWRKANPELYLAEKERVRNKYANNTEYSEKAKVRTYNRYYRLKAAAKTKET